MYFVHEMNCILIVFIAEYNSATDNSFGVLTGEAAQDLDEMLVEVQFC